MFQQDIEYARYELFNFDKNNGPLTRSIYL